MNKQNIILNTDSYKLSHYKQYPKDTQTIYSYIESRGGRFDNVLFFGLQMFIKEYLTKPITALDIIEAKDVSQKHGLPFNEEGWTYILKEHGGKLPLRIRAVNEGTIVPVSNVLVTMENTDPKCYWLTNYIETALVRAIWYPTTVATQSYEIKKMIYKYLEETSDDPDGQINFKLHDFGARGVSSFESAGIGGLAHLVNFLGTDTVTATMYAREYYNEDMAGFSIPASEHSTMTSWGRNNEQDAFENMIEQYGGEGKMFACVSDSYDIYNAVNNIWGDKLKNKVVNNGGTLVVRPDSGVPEKVVPQVIKDLMGRFGSTKNSKGYRVLPSYIRVIQGDGVNYDSINRILEKLKEEKISAENLAFGMGGALLQQLDRDTQQFAMKCSAILRGGNWQDVYKEPVTDAEMSFKKASKPGRLTLIWDNNKKEYRTERYPLAHQAWRPDPASNWSHQEVMHTVYENGKLVAESSLSDIRNRVEVEMKKDKKDVIPEGMK